jgi:hypothetical protein
MTEKSWPPVSQQDFDFSASLLGREMHVTIIDDPVKEKPDCLKCVNANINSWQEPCKTCCDPDNPKNFPAFVKKV